MIVTALTRQMLKQRRADRKREIQRDYDEQLDRAHNALALSSRSTPAPITKLPAAWPFPVKS